MSDQWPPSGGRNPIPKFKHLTLDDHETESSSSESSSSSSASPERDHGSVSQATSQASSGAVSTRRRRRAERRRQQHQQRRQLQRESAQRSQSFPTHVPGLMTPLGRSIPPLIATPAPRGVFPLPSGPYPGQQMRQAHGSQRPSPSQPHPHHRHHLSTAYIPQHPPSAFILLTGPPAGSRGLPPIPYHPAPGTLPMHAGSNPRQGQHAIDWNDVANHHRAMLGIAQEMAQQQQWERWQGWQRQQQPVPVAPSQVLRPIPGLVPPPGFYAPHPQQSLQYESARGVGPATGQFPPQNFVQQPASSPLRIASPSASLPPRPAWFYPEDPPSASRSHRGRRSD